MDYEGLGYPAELAPNPWAESSPKLERAALLPSGPEREDRKSVHFARAALIFHDRLKSIRRKRDTLPLTPPDSPEPNDHIKVSQVAAVSVKPTTIVTPPETPTPPRRNASKASQKHAHNSSDSPETTNNLPPKHIRILRACQSILTAAFSLCIAVFQGNVFNLYLQSGNNKTPWPKDPNLMPTLLLFVVAVFSIVFDVCLILAYTAHSKRCITWVVRVAGSAHYIVATVKGISFALTAAVCKTGFDAGKANGDSNDLWGWTCSDLFKNGEHGVSSCDTQKVAWVFAVVQACIEALGMAIDRYTKRKVQVKGPKAKPLLQEDEEMKLEAMFTDIDIDLPELTPSLSSN